MLTKLYLTNPNIAIYPLSEIKNYDGFAIIDCFNRIYRDHRSFLPQIFNNNQVFISSNSFQQNHIVLSRRIRKYASKFLGESIIAIGGESYLYGITLCKNIIHYTNSKYIYEDCQFNNKFYRKNIENNLIDYNINNISDKYNYCLVNLSSLPKNLIEKLNKNLYFKIIIISCNHEDFWKKIKYLSNYKLKIRKKFICWKIGYFLTVNIFVPNFISLGGNCSVAYQLQKYNLRKISYPFDWCKIKFNKLVEVLIYNFERFQDIEIVKYSENHDNSYIIKNKYNTFAHEVTCTDKLADFSKKLEKRVNKFKRLDNIIFVRLELDNVKDYSYLTNELDKIFNNYKLIVISKKKPLGNIIFFELPKFIDWKCNNFDWDIILKN